MDLKRISKYITWDRKKKKKNCMNLIKLPQIRNVVLLWQRDIVLCTLVLFIKKHNSWELVRAILAQQPTSEHGRGLHETFGHSRPSAPLANFWDLWIWCAPRKEIQRKDEKVIFINNYQNCLIFLFVQSKQGWIAHFWNLFRRS